MTVLGEFTDCSLYASRFSLIEMSLGFHAIVKKANITSKIGNQKEHNSIPPLIMKNEVIIESVSRKGESISEMEKCCLLSYWLLSIVCAGK